MRGESSPPTPEKMPEGLTTPVTLPKLAVLLRAPVGLAKLRWFSIGEEEEIVFTTAHVRNGDGPTDDASPLITILERAWSDALRHREFLVRERIRNECATSPEVVQVAVDPVAAMLGDEADRSADKAAELTGIAVPGDRGFFNRSDTSCYRLRQRPIRRY